MSNSSQTKDHTIKKWVEERNGKPTIIKDTDAKGKNEGVLRIRFDEHTEELKPISWDEFFKIFDKRKVAFLYDEDKESTFNKFVYS